MEKDINKQNENFNINTEENNIKYSQELVEIYRIKNNIERIDKNNGIEKNNIERIDKDNGIEKNNIERIDKDNGIEKNNAIFIIFDSFLKDNFLAEIYQIIAYLYSVGSLNKILKKNLVATIIINKDEIKEFTNKNLEQILWGILVFFPYDNLILASEEDLKEKIESNKDEMSKAFPDENLEKNLLYIFGELKNCFFIMKELTSEILAIKEENVSIKKKINDSLKKEGEELFKNKEPDYSSLKNHYSKEINNLMNYYNEKIQNKKQKINQKEERILNSKKLTEESYNKIMNEKRDKKFIEDRVKFEIMFAQSARIFMRKIINIIKNENQILNEFERKKNEDQEEEVSNSFELNANYIKLVSKISDNLLKFAKDKIKEIIAILWKKEIINNIEKILGISDQQNDEEEYSKLESNKISQKKIAIPKNQAYSNLIDISSLSLKKTSTRFLNEKTTANIINTPINQMSMNNDGNVTNNQKIIKLSKFNKKEKFYTEGIEQYEEAKLEKQKVFNSLNNYLKALNDERKFDEKINYTIKQLQNFDMDYEKGIAILEKNIENFVQNELQNHKQLINIDQQIIEKLIKEGKEKIISLLYSKAMEQQYLINKSAENTFKYIIEKMFYSDLPTNLKNKISILSIYYATCEGMRNIYDSEYKNNKEELKSKIQEIIDAQNKVDKIESNELQKLQDINNLPVREITKEEKLQSRQIIKEIIKEKDEEIEMIEKKMQDLKVKLKLSDEKFKKEEEIKNFKKKEPTLKEFKENFFKPLFKPIKWEDKKAKGDECYDQIQKSILSHKKWVPEWSLPSNQQDFEEELYFTSMRYAIVYLKYEQLLDLIENNELLVKMDDDENNELLVKVDDNENNKKMNEQEFNEMIDLVLAERIKEITQMEEEIMNNKTILTMLDKELETIDKIEKMLEKKLILSKDEIKNKEKYYFGQIAEIIIKDKQYPYPKDYNFSLEPEFKEKILPVASNYTKIEFQYEFLSQLINENVAMETKRNNEFVTINNNANNSASFNEHEKRKSGLYDLHFSGEKNDNNRIHAKNRTSEKNKKLFFEDEIDELNSDNEMENNYKIQYISNNEMTNNYEIQNITDSEDESCILYDNNGKLPIPPVNQKDDSDDEELNKVLAQSMLDQ